MGVIDDVVSANVFGVIGSSVADRLGRMLDPDPTPDPTPDAAASSTISSSSSIMVMDDAKLDGIMDVV